MIYSGGKNGKHPWYISTIEMGSLWHAKTYLENTASLSKRNYAKKGSLDLSKEVLQVSVGQRTAKS